MWAQFCMQCGTAQFRSGTLQPPPDVAAPVGARTPPPWAPSAEVPAPVAVVQDMRAHITIGYLLAFVATLVLPPLFGAIGFGLGYLAYARGAAHQRQQGLWVMAANVAATVLGLAIALYIDHLGILNPA